MCCICRLMNSYFHLLMIMKLVVISQVSLQQHKQMICHEV